MTVNKNIKLIINYVIGPLVFCILVYSIYSQVQQQPNWKESLDHLVDGFSINSFWKLFIAFLLMFVNWGLEARKWQLALSAVEPVSFRRSLGSIFSGTTMGFFTPNRIGEYFGRVLFVKENARISSVALTIMCGTAQLLITLIAGFAGLFFIRSYIGPSNEAMNAGFWIQMLMYITLPVAMILLVFYFRLAWMVSWINRLAITQKIGKYLEVLGNFELKMLLRILLISFVRYLVFILQYYLLLQVFEVELNWWQTFWSMSVIFLVLAVIPSIAIFTDLGIRWKASLQFLALFSSNSVGILGASLSIWLINLVIPAIIGSMLIFSVRIFNTGRENYLRDTDYT